LAWLEIVSEKVPELMSEGEGAFGSVVLEIQEGEDFPMPCHKTGPQWALGLIEWQTNTDPPEPLFHTRDAHTRHVNHGER
jgi:hypothetical protein